MMSTRNAAAVSVRVLRPVLLGLRKLSDLREVRAHAEDVLLGLERGEV